MPTFNFTVSYGRRSKEQLRGKIIPARYLSRYLEKYPGWDTPSDEEFLAFNATPSFREYWEKNFPNCELLGESLPASHHYCYCSSCGCSSCCSAEMDERYGEGQEILQEIATNPRRYWHLIVTWLPERADIPLGNRSLPP